MGGPSREREISFAGGRTVYDNLDRRLFAPVPLFITTGGHLVELDWHYIYKGTIRDFYPPPHASAHQSFPWQRYEEHLGASAEAELSELRRQIGTPRQWEELPEIIDFAFLTLHGIRGEDGGIQGKLEWLGIPYSGTGILGAALALDKSRQREVMRNAGFAVPKGMIVSVDAIDANPDEFTARVATEVGFPCVVKHPLQGSSIGVRVAKNEEELFEAVEAVRFRKRFSAAELAAMPEQEVAQLVAEMLDLRHAIGLPVWATVGPQDPVWIATPEVLHRVLTSATADVLLEAPDTPSRLVIEVFIAGREFSVIVIESPEGKSVALPPTEIIKPGLVYDYRGKYLPGIARKQTPMALSEESLKQLCATAEKLKDALFIEVYARLDGLLADDGTAYFNDPNTTSGMLPGSFFFHQAAEVGFAPSEFLTYLIAQSYRRRVEVFGQTPKMNKITLELETLFAENKAKANLPKVAVIFGGPSAERHISVESGRNVFEKLNSSGEYQPVPVFLLGHAGIPQEQLQQAGFAADPPFSLWELPIGLLLKDNADDIAEAIVDGFDQLSEGSGTFNNVARISPFAKAYQSPRPTSPSRLSWERLKTEYEFAFLALHGRPGEDGQLQRVLEKLRIPYNGSGPSAAELCMDKYATNERLKAAGLLVPRHRLIEKQEWRNFNVLVEELTNSYDWPLIAKPVDDGCSAAVRKINSTEELRAYGNAIFRDRFQLEEDFEAVIQLQSKEEFPMKQEFLIEEMVSANGANKFIEVTVGFVTSIDDTGAIYYQALTPSEAVAGGGILSLEEKFLAGQGQNLTPAQFSDDPANQHAITEHVKREIERAAAAVGAEGYGRIDAFVRVFEGQSPEVIFIEINALPGLTPATVIFHQAALEGWSPFTFLDRLIRSGVTRYPNLP